MSEGDDRGRVMTDEERARAVREQLKGLHTFDLAYETMVGLITFGYQKLGLTGETAELRDLDDAHYAIELLGAILKVSDREHPVSDLRDLHSTLAQMQLGYVQALELEGRRPEPPEQPAAAGAAAEQTGEVPREAASEADAEAAHEATADEVAEHLAEDEAFAEEPPEPPAAPQAAAAKRARRPAAKKPAAKKPAAGNAAPRKPGARKKPAPEPGSGDEG